MPNTFIENRDRWLTLSEIDYLGQFVKAWLAFNAWYRNAYNERQDRKIINEVKCQPNPILNKLRPLLTNSTEESEQFRGDIGLLHHRLENYELHCGKGNDKQRITLTNIYLKDNPPLSIIEKYQGWSFRIERLGNGKIKIEVVNRKGMMILEYQQEHYDLTELELKSSHRKDLSRTFQGYLYQRYQQVVPICLSNLIEGSDLSIRCSAYEFRCGRDALFAGTLEALYLMRCTLFHGELVPTKEANACYEPAYRLVRRFLDCVS